MFRFAHLIGVDTSNKRGSLFSLFSDLMSRKFYTDVVGV
jgi:hypothetical protein